MGPPDDSIFLETEETRITSDNVVVNTGWTTTMAFWNTFGTVLGALIGIASLVLAWVIWQGQITSEEKIRELDKRLSRYEKVNNR